MTIKKKLLLATDVHNQVICSNILKRLIPLKKAGLESIILFQRGNLDFEIDALAGSGIECTVVRDNIFSSSRIFSIADKEDIPFIIVHFQGNKKKKSLYNSTIRNLIDETTRPLMLINGLNNTVNTGEEGFFHHMILAENWSISSKKAFDFILDYKDAIKELEIVNVISKKLTIREMRTIKDRMMKSRKVCLDEKIDAESHIYAGKISKEILTSAKDYKATGIVMGRSSQKGIINRFFKESLPYEAAIESTLPVIVVPS